MIWTVQGVLELPPMPPNHQIIGSDFCAIDGVEHPELVVIAETAPFEATPLIAWKADKLAHDFVSIPIDGITCENESA